MEKPSSHLEFTGAPDPMRMMQTLSSMQPDQLEAAMEMMQEMKTKSDPTTQEGIREHWEKLKENEVKLQKMKKRGLHSVTSTQSWEVKKTLSTSSINPSEYNPILITDMGLGNTHRGRILIGCVSGGGGFWSIASGAFLLEDLCGSVIEVAVYNYPKDTFAKDFPHGHELCIIEPFYKMRGDGSVGVRVDNPSEICNYSLPQTGEGWKEFGNFCIKHSPPMALSCYEFGLGAPSIAVLDHLQLFGRKRSKQTKQKLDREALDLMLQVSKLLTNLSICDFNLKNFDSSLLCALLAFGLGLDRPKAAFRVGKALHSSGLEDEARYFAAWYCRRDEMNSSPLRTEFRLSQEDINTLDGGSSFIRNNTPSLLAEASKSIQLQQGDYNDNWLLAKEQGTDHFKKGETAEAKRCYAAALFNCPFREKLFRDAVSS